ncbi:Na(+)-translocating NADH-quinone reductase subunit F [Mesonia aestuariivivens]|uniref:Na(+)-translocating NADH-quinone reductase subunit F n=1 Tax=Mesonia aestuariivivens TaxID=2796128 RepID=A0ABS6VZC4_9FLAO|nr:Na(+)-translocating NADH-quinone reductase subunit F [Mesonia aestuariivivens]MBW2960937.1 Na(+)-translocating NADH-quinone reductase subunit F [Mesonia aestuariivivens]
MKSLSEQELHQLAMNIVGKDLEARGFEFLGINSALKRNPQFVALKDKKLHFVIVRAVTYPKDPKKMDLPLMEKIKEHALKFNASTFYAGVGIANSLDLSKAVTLEEDYVVNYSGIQAY